jgi:hypothetical protein
MLAVHALIHPPPPRQHRSTNAPYLVVVLTLDFIQLLQLVFQLLM